jgi:hypothetical protein
LNVDIEAPDLTDYQIQFLYCPQRFSVVEASTKTGKTFSHIWWLFELAHGENEQWFYHAVQPGWSFWWIAPIYQTSEMAFLRLKGTIENVPGYKFNLSKLTITTPLRTVIHFKSADKPDSLYGDDVYGFVFDEFTRAKQAAWVALRSVVTFTQAPGKFIGNYTGQSNWGHKLTNKAKTDPQEYAAFRVTAYDAVRAGILDEKEIEQARQDLPLSVFTALYLAEGVSDDSILFPEKVLEDCFTNDFVQPGQKYISADIALHGSDRFVVIVWAGMIVEAIYTIDKCDAKQAEEFIKAKANEWQVPQRNIVYDHDGIGAFLAGYLRNAYGFVNGSTPIQSSKDKINYTHLKAQCFFALSKAMADNRIWIKPQQHKENIMLELENIRKDGHDREGKIGVTRKDDVKKVLGFSPDFADALMMRMIFELPIKRFAKMI